MNLLYLIVFVLAAVITRYLGFERALVLALMWLGAGLLLDPEQVREIRAVRERIVERILEAFDG